MKTRSWLFIGNLTLLLWLAPPVMAADLVKYSASPTGSSMKIEGTSTLHDWTMVSTLVGGTLEIGSQVDLDPAKTTLPGLDGDEVPIKAKTSITVRSLKSHATAMDNVCQDAMDAKQFPRIEYQLTKLALKKTEHKVGAPWEFMSLGELAIHGVTNKVIMPVTLERLDDARLRVKGAVPLKMTTFGVKPPSPAIGLGAIKTGDDVKLSFEWLVVKKADAPTEK